MTAEPLRQPALHGLVATLVTLTLLASCGSPDDDSRAAPSPTQHTASPLAPYMSLLALDSAEQLRLDLEGERLIAACLKEQTSTTTSRTSPTTSSSTARSTPPSGLRHSAMA